MAEGVKRSDEGGTAARVLAVTGALAAELHPRRKLPEPALDSSLDRDLGFDSLGRVELMARLEREFGVALGEQVFATAETPRDLLRAILGAEGAASAAPAPSSTSVVPEEAGAIALPVSAETLVDVLDWHAVRHGDRVYVRFWDDDGDGARLTYGALAEAARRVAAGLQAKGVEPGQAVALMLPSDAGYFHAFFGILAAGAIPVPMYPPARPNQIEEHLKRQAGILSNCRAPLMVTVPEATPLAHLLEGRAEDLRHVMTVEELMAAADHVPALPTVRAGDIAFIQYTSGSTGAPKGVVLSHANLLANVRVMGEVIEARPDEDVFVSWLPLYHDMGLIGACLSTLYYAVPLVLMSPLAFLARPKRWLEAMHRFRGTLSAAPNFAYELCVSAVHDGDLEGWDLSRWRVSINGAEAVSPDTMERFIERFAPAGFRRETLMPAFGLAECSVGLTFPPLGRGAAIDAVARGTFTGTGRAEPASADGVAEEVLRFVGCGRPLPGHEVRIVDGAGRELPERHEGRLQFRGPSATSGYFRNPEQTRALFDGDWLESGDRAYLADGELFVTGRAKDIIIRAGRNIYPAELEDAVGDLEGVRRGCVAVFGGTDKRSGTERLVVLAECRARDDEGRATLEARIRDLAMDLTGLPPDEVVLAPPNTVLKTSSGKVRRAATRDLFERGLVGKPRRAVWLQVIRLALSGVGPRLRRGMRSALAVLYAGYAWAVFALAALPLWLLAVALPTRKLRWTGLRSGLRLVARLAGIKLQVRELETLPEGPAVLVCNHASYLDGFLLTALLPNDPAFVAKAELASAWPVRIPFQRLGMAYVERFDARKGVEDTKSLADMVAAGRPLLFFPEGTFTRMPGLLPFHMGAFAVAAEADVPVVPMALRGSRSVLHPESWFPRAGAVTLTLSAPLAPEGEDPWAAAVALRDAARTEVLRHCGEPDLSHETAEVFRVTPP